MKIRKIAISLVFIWISMSATASACCSSSESLTQTDFIGQWNMLIGDFSNGLIINDDFSGSFYNLENGVRVNGLSFASDEVTFHEDLIIIDVYMTRPRGLIRRFTLSGWKSSNTTRIYGYMYLYDGFGRQFNGVSVMFEKDE